MEQTSANNKKNIKIRKGLDLKIKGSPKAQEIREIEEKTVSQVAVTADDYPGIKPTFLVKEGDKVKKGQPLFSDKKNPLVLYTAPAGGKVTAINRGQRRAFQSVVIETEKNEKEIEFNAYTRARLARLKKEDVINNLLQSGLWPSLIARPYGKVANPEKEAAAVFINAMDSAPHAPSADLIIGERLNAFEAGVKVLSRLTSGKTYVVKKSGSTLPDWEGETITNVCFSGPHPSGLSGTHIHFLEPVHKNKEVWSVQYPDVLAIGELFLSGKLHVERIISLAGPAAENPRLIKTRRGAWLQEICQGESYRSNDLEKVRVVSGSLLSGRSAEGSFAYLGQFHNQISLISEKVEREFMGWLAPGFNKFSVKNVFASSCMGAKKEWNFTTALNGSHRTIIPVGSYEKVMPLDMEPTFLLRALLSNNLELAEDLGVLELIEEDMALLTFVSPTKDNFAANLRHTLTEIEREG